MQNKLFLKSLGLSENAANIYMYLLSNKPSGIAKIAQESKIYRPAVYKALPELLSLGLISKTPTGKRQLFTALPPSNLKNLFSSKQKEFEQRLPELEELYRGLAHKPVINFFEGKEGIRRAFEYLLDGAKKNDIIYRYESPKNYRQNAKLYPRAYKELATKNNKYGHSLVQKFDITNEATHLIRKNYLERFGKAIPAKLNKFEFNITQIILNDKVAFIDYESYTASIIQSPRFADFQKQLFKILFDKL